jgi:membrane protein
VAAQDENISERPCAIRPAASPTLPLGTVIAPRRDVKRLLDLLKESGNRWVDDRCYRLGASLAFYALFSLFPLVLLCVTVFGFVLGDGSEIRDKILGAVAHSVSSDVRALLEQTLESMQAHRTARGIGAAVGLVALLLGASGVFSELDNALNLVWRTQSRSAEGMWATVRSAVKDKAVSFALVGVVAIAILLSVVASTALRALADTTKAYISGVVAWRVADGVVSIGFLTLLFAAVFRIVPKAHVEWRDVLGGALLTSVVFAGMKHLLAWYLGHVGSYAAYGAVGGVLGLLMWIYLVSLLLFYGAELTRVYAERFGSLARPSGAAARPQGDAWAGTLVARDAAHGELEPPRVAGSHRPRARGSQAGPDGGPSGNRTEGAASGRAR